MTNKPFPVRLTEAQHNVLKELAEKFDVTQAEIVRRAIRQFGLLRKYDPEGKCLYHVLRKAIDDVDDKAIDIWLFQRKKSRTPKHKPSLI